MRSNSFLAVSVLTATIASAQSPAEPPAPAVPARNPAIVENGVLNAASFATAGRPGHAVAPGSLVSIFGSELAPGLIQAGSIPLARSLGGITVQFVSGDCGGRIECVIEQVVAGGSANAPLLFVSGGQVNAQLPWDLAVHEPASVTVTRDGRSSAPRQFRVAPFSPGIFSFSGNGRGAGMVLNASDGSVAQTPGTVRGLTNRPARPGEIVLIYANGLGAVDPPVESGTASTDALRRTVTTPTVLIGGREAEVQFSGLAPQFVGVNQVNVVVPLGLLGSSRVPVQLRIGGITTSNLVTMAVDGPRRR